MEHSIDSEVNSSRTIEVIKLLSTDSSRRQPKLDKIDPILNRSEITSVIITWARASIGLFNRSVDQASDSEVLEVLGHVCGFTVEEFIDCQQNDVSIAHILDQFYHSFLDSIERSSFNSDRIDLRRYIFRSSWEEDFNDLDLLIDYLE